MAFPQLIAHDLLRNSEDAGEAVVVTNTAITWVVGGFVLLLKNSANLLSEPSKLHAYTLVE
jgi:hypothetical protein